MSDGNDKAPAWAVREIKIHERWPVYAVAEGDRLIMQTLNGADARRIVEAVNGAGEAQEDAAEVRVWRDHAGAIDDVLGGYSLTLSRVQAVQAVVRERDELRAKVARLTDARHTLAAVVLAVDKMLEELTDLVTIVGEP